MLAAVSLILAVLPVSFYLWGVWAMDRYDREPVWLILVNFSWGAFGAVAIVLIVSAVHGIFLHPDLYVRTIVIAPLYEEFIKGLFLLWTVRKNQFDNLTDGIVYGMAIGLGFGMTENFLYFLSSSGVEDWIFRIIFRSLFTVVLHAMATGVFGAFVGSTKFSDPDLRLPKRALGLALAITMHVIWNWALSIGTPLSFALVMVFFFMNLIVILGITQISLASERKLLYRELMEESLAGLIPAAHVPFLISYRKRKITGWFHPEAAKMKYIERATHLAFLRSRIDLLSGREHEDACRELAALRDVIARMIELHHESTMSKI